MKKTIRTLFLLLTLVFALSVAASASNFDPLADHLKEMGLFKGSNNGYELDRAPTRAEAAVMLTRMLGQERNAEDLYCANEISHPFTDTEAWMDPYLAFLYDQGYTTGATETTFEPYQLCSDQMYTTFLLRALGYFEKNGDFSYTDAMTFGTEIGLVDMVNTLGSTFLRDNVVAMTFTALSIQPKGDRDTLFEVLKDDGVIPTGTAAEEFLDNYALLATMPTDIIPSGALAANMTADVAVSNAGVSMMTGDMDMNLAVSNVDPANLAAMELAMTGDMNLSLNPDMVAEGQPTESAMNFSLYLKDDWMYLNAMGMAFKMEMGMNNMMAELGDTSATTTTTTPISMLTDCSVTTKGATKTYTMAISPAFMVASMEGAAQVPGTEEMPAMSMDINALEMTMVLKSGKLDTMTATMDMDISAEGMTMNMLMDMDFTFDQLTGDIQFPTDLASYRTMEEFMTLLQSAAQ